MADTVGCTAISTFAWMQTIPWFLVILGWIIAIWQAKKHDNRIDARAAIDRILDLLSQLERQALDYHMNSEVSSVDAIVIKSQIERISSHIRSLQLLSAQDFQILALLRQSITLNNFDSAGHQAQAHDSMLLHEIGYAINRLGTLLEQRYNTKYR